MSEINNNEKEPETPIEKEPETPTEKELEITEERIYTIPLRFAWRGPRQKRAPKSVRIIKEFIKKHMKLDKNEKKGTLVIKNEVNEKIWEKGIQKPPRKIRVRVTKDKEDIITVHLAEGK
jgi:large subunit ribosomal protein L31e